MSHKLVLIFIGTTLGATCMTRPSNATPNFPGVVEQFVGSTAPPACTICHNNPSGGLGTVTTSFGKYLRSRGAIASDEASLRQALMAAQAENHDSDGDGVSDIEAIREGLDPNGNLGKMSGPEFGCATLTAPRRSATVSVALCVALLAALGRRTRRS